jgi:hypothetical protein
VTKIAFSDLVQIYRNTRFDGNGEGVLTVVNEEIVATLRAIEADERLYDEVQLSLINPESVDVGSQVRINVASPKLSLGILASDFDSLFSSPGAAFKEPDNYYVIGENYARGDQPIPTVLARYRALLSVIAILRDAASYADDVQREIVFIGTEKVTVPIAFNSSDLHCEIDEQANRFLKIFKDPLHVNEKIQLLAATVIAFVAGQRTKQRLVYLIANLDRVCDEVEKGYRLFASSFSYSKIKNQVEAARLEYVNKIHKTIVDIQGQLLGIPIATIIVASQLKPSFGCDIAFWTNSAVLLGAWIFVGLLLLAVINQWHTLSALWDDVNGQQDRLTNDYAAISDEFINVFVGLQKRIKWHRKVLFGVMFCAVAGVTLATFAYFMLSADCSWVCIMFWR